MLQRMFSALNGNANPVGSARQSAEIFADVPTEYLENPEKYLSFIAGDRDFIAGLPNSVPEPYRDMVMNAYNKDPDWLQLINYLANKPRW